MYGTRSFEGAKYEVEVFKKEPIASPLLQGGLEIPIKVSATWDSPEKLSTLMEKVKYVQYPIAKAYTDNSKEILKELVGDEMDENSDCEVEDGENEIELIDE